MIKEFNNLEEIKKYYDKETNTYIFKEDGEYIDLVVFNFDLDVEANIDSWDINALDINALDINALDIKANDINATDINATDINANDIDARDINALDIIAKNINANDIIYCVVCYAYNNIKCKSIKGRAPTTNHFVLNGKLEVENNE